MAFYMKGAPFQNKENRAEVKAAKEGVVVSERLKDRVKDVAEKGVDETILKFSKSEVTGSLIPNFVP